MNCFLAPESDEERENEEVLEQKTKSDVAPVEMVRDPNTVVDIKRPTSLSPTELKVLKLQDENRKLRAELEKSQEEVERWRSVSTNLFNTLILSPENCEYLKKVTTEQITNALKNVDHEVQFVDCSFPASPTNAPELKLLSTENAEKSQWDLKWDPNWSVKVLCSAKKAGVPYSVLIRVSNFEIRGALNLTLAPDVSQVTLQFTCAPFIGMELESAVKVGPQIPMPVRNLIDKTMRSACDSWISRNLVAPKAMSLKLDRLKRKGLSDEDLKYATQAALEGERRSRNF